VDFYAHCKTYSIFIGGGDYKYRLLPADNCFLKLLRILKIFFGYDLNAVSTNEKVPIRKRCIKVVYIKLNGAPSDVKIMLLFCKFMELHLTISQLF
jgi:hypothetical protein